LKLLADELRHRFRQDDNEQEDFINEDKTERGVYCFQVIERVSTIKSRNMIEKKQRGEMHKEKQHGKPYDQYFKSSDISNSNETVKQLGEVTEIDRCHRRRPRRKKEKMPCISIPDAWDVSSKGFSPWGHPTD
jgi:hypothetical protein